MREAWRAFCGGIRHPQPVAAAMFLLGAIIMFLIVVSWVPA